MSRVGGPAADPNARAARLSEALEPFVILAILMVVPAVSLSAADGTAETVADVLNWISWVALALLLGAPIAVAGDRVAWIRSHPLDIVIVAATPPVLGAPAQLVRLLRLVRLVRALQGSRRLLRQVFTPQGLRAAAVLTVLAAVIGGELFARFEDDTVGRGFYWAVVTMATVGYGDVVPTTAEGRILAIVMIGVGVTFMAIITGAIAERFVRPEAPAPGVARPAGAEPTAALEEVRFRLDRIEGLLREALEKDEPGPRGRDP